jgi:hypothetical protein
MKACKENGRKNSTSSIVGPRQMKLTLTPRLLYLRSTNPRVYTRQKSAQIALLQNGPDRVDCLYRDRFLIEGTGLDQSA